MGNIRRRKLLTLQGIICREIDIALPIHVRVIRPSRQVERQIRLQCSREIVAAERTDLHTPLSTKDPHPTLDTLKLRTPPTTHQNAPLSSPLPLFPPFPASKQPPQLTHPPSPSLPLLRQRPHRLARALDPLLPRRAEPARMPHLPVRIPHRPEILRAAGDEAEGGGGRDWGEGGVGECGQGGR